MGHDNEGPLLIALGPSFVTGHDGDVARRFRQLERWVRRNVPAGDVAWRWVNEDYDTPDRVPYAGSLGQKAPGLYVATGFNAWGISNGTAAAMLIADQIVGRSNPWAALYDPELRVTGRCFRAMGRSFTAPRHDHSRRWRCPQENERQVLPRHFGGAGNVT